MAITDNRTLITAADALTNIVDLTGAATGTLDADTLKEGTNSIGVKNSASLDGILYNFGSPQDFTGTHFYHWWQVSTPGKLQLKSAGGVRVRFCGATITDWFEVYIEGSDTYGGGWQMQVTDITTARANAVAGTLGGVNGTTPAVSAIQYVGIVFDLAGMFTGNNLNTYVDSQWYLPPNTPGIIVAGQTGGNPYVWDDVVLEADINDINKAWGTISKANGVISLNTPVQIGATTGTNEFVDLNQVIAWQDQLVAPEFYGLTIECGTGATTIFKAGTQVGTGDDAIGNQGWVITAAPEGQRWYFDSDQIDITESQLLGCTLIHGATFSVGATNFASISNQISDTSYYDQYPSVFLGNTVLNADTISGEAFLVTSDPSNIKLSTFVFSLGHAIEITSPGTYTLLGDKFNSYLGTPGSNATAASGSTGAAIYNNSGGFVTLNITGGGDTPSIRNGIGATTQVNNNVSITFTGLRESTEVRIMEAGSETVELAGIEDAIDGVFDSREFTWSVAAGTTVDYRIGNIIYEIIEVYGFIPNADATIPIQQRFDRSYLNG